MSLGVRPAQFGEVPHNPVAKRFLQNTDSKENVVLVNNTPTKNVSAKRAPLMQAQPLQDQQNLKLQEELGQLRNRVRFLEAELTKSHQRHEQDAHKIAGLEEQLNVVVSDNIAWGTLYTAARQDLMDHGMF